MPKFGMANIVSPILSLKTKSNPNTFSFSPDRLIGLDLIRFIAIIAITEFHFNEAVFVSDLAVFSWQEGFWYELMSAYARVFSFSGFIIIALTCFLFGLTSQFQKLKSKHIPLVLLLTIGAFVILPLYGGDGEYFFEWDIYHFLIFNFILLWLLKNRSFKFFAFVGGVSFFILWVPFWELKGLIPMGPLFEEILLGRCENYKIGAWPILPWSGLVGLFYFLGLWAKKYRKDLRLMHKWDLLFIPALLASIPFLGSYYSVLIGPSFYCFMNRHEPYIFWSHLIWLIFFIRLSFWDTYNQNLHKLKIVVWISQLKWSTRFGLCYLTHLIIVWFYANFTTYFLKHPTMAALAMATVLPFTEIIIRSISQGFSFYEKHYTTDKDK